MTDTVKNVGNTLFGRNFNFDQILTAHVLAVQGDLIGGLNIRT
jgi:hypothetical protein